MAEQVQQSNREFPGGKRYRTLKPWLNENIGPKTWRVPIDAGFTCPTRDGSRGHDGCLYCDAGGARSSHTTRTLSVRQQIDDCFEKIRERHGAERAIAYFQAFTNTYDTPERLRETYREALLHPSVAALAIGTRPDCLEDPVIQVLEEIASKTTLWVEVGLQTTCEEALTRAGRGHSVSDFIDAIERLHARGIRTVAHVMAGLPGDTHECFLAGAQLLNRLGVWGVKVHNLYIDSRAPFSEHWRRGEITLPERDQYRDCLIEFLEQLNPDTVVHRLIGHAPTERHLAPDWALHKPEFLRDLDAEMDRRDTWQGRCLKKDAS